MATITQNVSNRIHTVRSVSKKSHKSKFVKSESIQVFLDARGEKLYAYISVFDGELDVISSLQSLQITLELAVVKEDLLHHIGPLNESKCLLKDKVQHHRRINILLKTRDPRPVLRVQQATLQN